MYNIEGITFSSFICILEYFFELRRVGDGFDVFFRFLNCIFKTIRGIEFSRLVSNVSVYSVKSKLKLKYIFYNKLKQNTYLFSINIYHN